MPLHDKLVGNKYGKLSELILLFAEFFLKCIIKFKSMKILLEIYCFS